MSGHITVIAVLLCAPAIAAGEQHNSQENQYWPGWRGPDRDGRVAGFQPPDQWPAELHRSWQVEVGTGYASPLVSGNRVYQHARQGDEEVVWCLDLESGAVQWRRAYAVPFEMGKGGERHGKGPKSSPALSNGRLVTMSITGILSSWSAESGELQWRRDYGSEFGKSHLYWGTSTSPLVDGDRVIVHFGTDGQGALVALDADSGDERWRQGNDGPSYSSPILAEIQGVRQVIDWNERAVVGVAAESGEALWEHPLPQAGSEQNMPTPVFHEGLVLIGAEKRGIRALEVKNNAGVWEVHEPWHQDAVALDMSSAVVSGDLLYGFSHYGSGRLFCLDIESGEVLWQGPARSGENAMLLAIPGYIVALLDSGELWIVKASRESFQKAASYRVSENSTWAPPVLLERGFLVKDHETLSHWSLQADESHVLVDVKRRTTDKKWTPRETRTIRHLSDFQPDPNTIETSRYGGRKDRRVEATGFFRAEKLDDRWWLVDPEGYLWYSVGCCSVRPNDTERGRAELKDRFGDTDGWARHTARLLRDHGFNTLACWSHAEHFRSPKTRIPYTTQSNFMSGYGKLRGGTYQKPGHTGYPNDCIFVFDPEFEDFCRRHAKEVLSATKDDPWLLGHFSDNEMPFRHDSLDRYLELDATDPGRIAAKRWTEEHNVEKGPEGGYSTEDRDAFLEFLSDTYFRIVSRAIGEADPNHMFFGSRFHGSVLRSAGVFRGCGPHVDVLSCNYYGAWTPDPERMSNWTKWSGRPFMVTEWYAKGMDSGMANITGAGWTVRTQKDRGRFYQNFTLGLLEQPNCVGWHWFKYIDNDPTNTKADPSNLDSNKGIVSNLYEPYPDLLELMRELNGNVYALRDFLAD